MPSIASTLAAFVVFLGALAWLPVPVTATAGERPAPPVARPVSLREPVRALAARRAGVVAATADQAFFFDGDSVMQGRFGAGERPARGPSLRRRQPDDFAASAGILDDTDFNDPYDTDSDIEDPENLFIDHAGRRGRPAPGRSQDGGTIAVAVAGDDVWIGRPDGLWHVGAGHLTATRISSMAGAAEDGFATLAASSDGRWVAAAHRGWLSRSGDGGRIFDVLAPTTGAARRLGITMGGVVFVLDDDEVHVAWPDRAMALPIGPVGATDLAVCGDDALVLAQGRLFAIRSGDLRTSAARLPVREVGPVPGATDRLACAADGTVIAAFGARLWTSRDAGHSWSLRDELPPVQIGAVALAERTAWVATPAGLWRLPLDARPAPPSDSLPTTRRPQTTEPDPSAAVTRGTATLAPPAAWWWGVLPVVDLGFVVARTSSHRDVRAFVLLTFLLDRNRGRTLERQRFAAELANRQRTDAVLSLALSRPLAGSRDPLDAEERAALVHAQESP